MRALALFSGLSMQTRWLNLISKRIEKFTSTYSVWELKTTYQVAKCRLRKILLVLSLSNLFSNRDQEKGSRACPEFSLHFQDMTIQSGMSKG